ncbi:endonuclease/exonuclease/phosphatase family protein [Flavisolibacter sp. BT320]|nr:endonuclease/exonuclease/phosphatase family protein [Flavisolibacter longurius]
MLFKSFVFVLLWLSTALSTDAQEADLRLVSYNVRNGKGMDNRTDYDRTAAVIQKAAAQVVALQELDSSTARSQGVEVLSVLAQKTGMHAVYGPAIPYGGGKYGVGILSKEKPLQHYTVSLPGREEQRVLLVAEFNEFVVFNTHLSLTEEDRMTSIAIINREADQFQKPVFLLGDLNAEPTSSFLIQLKKDWQLLSGEAPTFPAPLPDKCIDYILSRNSKMTVSHAEVMDEPQASDHRPVLVTLKAKLP